MCGKSQERRQFLQLMKFAVRKNGSILLHIAIMLSCILCSNIIWYSTDVVFRTVAVRGRNEGDTPTSTSGARKCGDCGVIV